MKSISISKNPIIQPKTKPGSTCGKYKQRHYIEWHGAAMQTIVILVFFSHQKIYFYTAACILNHYKYEVQLPIWEKRDLIIMDCVIQIHYNLISTEIQNNSPLHVPITESDSHSQALPGKHNCLMKTRHPPPEISRRYSFTLVNVPGSTTSYGSEPSK